MVYGQESHMQEINEKIRKIDSNTNLQLSEFDLAELLNSSFDGGGELRVWTFQDKIVKIDQVVGLSFGS